MHGTKGHAKRLQLSHNEIVTRAHNFVDNWRDAQDEKSETQPFWDAFFEVFGLSRRDVATYEERTKHIAKGKKTTRFIDVFWPGMLLVEQKSRGRDLDKAMNQARGYVGDLVREKRHQDIPRFLACCDFERMVLWDREKDRHVEFYISDLPKHIREFWFIAGYDALPIDPEAEVDIKAAERMAALHDALAEGGFPENELARFLTRVMFLMFAEDTGICGDQPAVFQRYLEKHTKSDGEGVGLAIQEFFDIFNKPKEKRPKRMPDELRGLEYVNGDLFAHRVDTAYFNSEMREQLLLCSKVDWEQISPQIFGALFQGIMEPKDRRQIGAHYTTEENILKVIGPLFLDELRSELDRIAVDRSTQRNSRLDAYLEKLGKLRFFDPACGCGNFLIVAYREVRTLETRALKERFVAEGLGHRSAFQRKLFDIRSLNKVRVSHFYGIEIGEFPAEIARVAMWLMDHILNRNLSHALGQYFARFPLTDAATICHGNALQMDWKSVLAPSEHVYLFGNPPFKGSVGKDSQSASQKADLKRIWGAVRRSGKLDYVTAWFNLAEQYIDGTGCRAAFVATNSIAMGDQVGVLWPYLFKRGIQMSFAHQPFEWTSDVRGKASVHVVIIGFSTLPPPQKIPLYTYESRKGQASRTYVRSLSPYLVEGPALAITARRRPFIGQGLTCGSSALDLGNLIIDSEAERDAILEECPALGPYVRPYCKSETMLSGKPLWCLWLVDAPPKVIRSSKIVRGRIREVRKFREGSTRKQTNRLKDCPQLFGEIRQPSSRFLAVPVTSSERRKYVPMLFLNSDVIISNKISALEDATFWHFGVLMSQMHNAWVRRVTGRTKSDIHYSNEVVFNNFPWPSASAARVADVEKCAKAVLDARSAHAGASLADMYDPDAMPNDLLKAHGALDRAVDKAYRRAKFKSDDERVTHLFSLYEGLVAKDEAENRKRKKEK